MGTERILSKLNSSDAFTSSPASITKAGKSVDYNSKVNAMRTAMEQRYDSLGVIYIQPENAGEGLVTPESGRIKITPAYYYHSDHLGSSSLMTDNDGNVSQHIEYLPFGEVFVEERNNNWNTPYKFNAKELDDETGLYYYGARYFDSRTSVWYGVDPLGEKYPNMSPYVYCANNPVKFIDPDGRVIKVYYRDDNGAPKAWSFNGVNQNKAPKNIFVNQILDAYNYNLKNGGGDKMKSAATATDYTLNLVYTEGHSEFQTTFDGPRTEGTVFWNPIDALETPKGTLSPATILEHEMDHGVEWQTNTPEYRKNKANSDIRFDNKEEKRVITGSEYKTGNANGELKVIPKKRIDKSSSYRGHTKNSKNTFIPVKSPISNIKTQ